MSRGTSLARGGARSTLGPRNALVSLCERGLPSRAFGTELRARLFRLLAFDAYCLNTCDTDTGVVTSSVGDGLTPQQAHALFAIEAEESDPSSLRELHRGPTRVASIWQTTHGKPEQSRRMREIFLPIGLGDELRAALVVDGACYGYLHLFRRCEQAPFGAADVAEVSAVGSLVARALRAQASLGAREITPRSDARASLAVIVLDAAGSVVRQSPEASAVLANRDSLRIDSGLAHVLRDVASRSREGSAAHATFVTEQRELRSVAAVQLGADTAIVVGAPSAEQVAALSLAAFALTPREREITRLVAAGRTNEHIASELGITLHTVKDHVKAALAKTRCRTRTELAARLRGA